MTTDADMSASGADTRRGGSVTRRNLLLGGGLGAASVLISARTASAAPNYSVIPKLPGEVSRLDTQYTSAGKKPYEAIDIVFSGDRTRLFVPHTAKPGAGASPLTVLWFYHSFGSTYESLSSAYKWSAMLGVDRGWVSVCPNYGGNLWVNSRAIWYQGEISRYMKTYFNVKTSYLRANSGGGALMSYAYGKRSVPNVRGMYMTNATFDMEDLYLRDPVRIGPAYDDSSASVAATNPAKLWASAAWAGTRIRCVVSNADVVVPPAQHGQALIGKALPYAVETSYLWHEQGHVVPAVADSDCITTFARWQSA